MPFSTHNPLIARSLILACLLLSAAASASAQARAEPPVVTKYQAITRQAGKTNPTQVLQGIGVLLTVCLGLLFVRAVRNEALAAREAELEGWASPSQRADSEEEDEAELVGVSAAQPEELPDPPEPPPYTANEQDTDSEPAEERDVSAPHAPHARVIYHVGPYRFSADREVLGPIAHNHLVDLCDALCSPDNTQRVVRVASGLSSRYAKSQVAAELAQMLAERQDVRVLALEGDLDAPALHRVMHINVPRGHGLSEQLQRMAELDSVDTASALQLSPNLHALVENRWSTPAALGLPQFSQLLSRQRDVYDFIIIDGPVVDSWPDAEHFGRLIDGVVFVTLASARLPDTLTLVGQHFPHDQLLRIIKTGEPTGS